MKRSIVAIAKCENYDPKNINIALDDIFNNLGSLKNIVGDAKNILIKVSCLKADLPETAINTHPEILRSTIRHLKMVTKAEISVGDSCIGTENIHDVYKKTGMEKVCFEENVKLVAFEKATLVNNFPIADAVLQADAVISLPKVKTHCLTNLTCAIKTMFGIVPGLAKINIHKDYPDIQEFSGVLCEIFNAKKPILTIADGILSMEGTGPVNGGLRDTKFITASVDSVANDAVVAEIIGLSPELVPTTVYANKNGFGVGDLKYIETRGATITEVSPKRFKLPPHKIIHNIPAVIFKFSNMFIGGNLPAPSDRCNLCQRCVKNCPKGAISKHTVNGREKLIFDKSKCILCLCCIEMCPKNALFIKQSFLLKILSTTKSTVLKLLGIFKR